MSEVTSVITAVPSAVTPAVPAGMLLRDTRTRLGLSVGEVAQRLRLAPRQIQAIENEEYDRLPGPTYTRGYLRSYARLLGLSPDEIIEHYLQHPSAASQVDLSKNTPTRQMSSEHHVIKITTLVVAGMVLGLAAIWWQGRDDSPVRLRKPAVAKPVDTAAQPAEPLRESVTDPRSPEVVSEATAVNVPRSTRESVGEFPRTAVPAVANPAETSVDAKGPLVLRFERESWADVRDAKQSRLLYTVVPAGRVVRLRGEAPFSIYLGNASGVRVEFKGETVDVGRYQRGPVARFSLGNNTPTATP